MGEDDTVFSSKPPFYRRKEFVVSRRAAVCLTAGVVAVLVAVPLIVHFTVGLRESVHPLMLFMSTLFHWCVHLIKSDCKPNRP